MVSRHPDRIALARELGAMDVVRERGGEAGEHVRPLAGEHGVHAVLECVRLHEVIQTAIEITRFRVANWVSIPSRLPRIALPVVL